MFQTFAATDVHVVLPTEAIFYVGSFPVTNALILGAIGIVFMLVVLVYAARRVQAGKHNFLSGLVSWAIEGLYSQVHSIIPDRKVARSIAPLALTIFFTVLFTYWISIIPGVNSITVGENTPVLRGLPTDLNFTFAIAIISIIAAQIYAVKAHGFFGNIGRYVVNPFTNPIGAFEGLLEIVGEFSRMIALSLRLFGNAFAGEVLLVVIAMLSGYFASLSLPFFMAFELFIGFIQAYVFFMLTLIFTALATISHHSSDDSHTSVQPKTVKSEI